MNFTKKIRSDYHHTQYACYMAYITQAVINNLAPLLFLIFRDTFGLPLQKITLLVTINFFIQLLIDLFGAKYSDRIGYRKLVVFGMFSCVIGLFGMAFFPFLLPDPFVGLLLAVFFNAIGGGLSEVLVSPIVEACPTENKEAAMSLLHSFYCWGCVGVISLSTLFLFAFGKGSWRVLSCIWAIVPFITALYFTQVPIHALNEGEEGMNIRELTRSGLFWLFFILMITAGASEQAMSQWASAFAESGLHVSKTLGDLLGPCFFAVLMGTSRVLYAKYADRLPLVKALIFCGSLCILSYLLAVLSPSPIFSLIGCGVCGFSVGIMWPGLFSLSAAKIPRGGTACFGLLALAGDVGCSGGPTVVGFVASAFSDNLKAGLAAAIIFPAVLILGSLLLMRRKN